MAVEDFVTDVASRAVEGAARARGRVEPENIEHLIEVSHHRHAFLLRELKKLSTPPSWDSRTKGWVGPVKDQGQCGSCWDFSGTGIIEIAFAVAGKSGLVLSEQYTLSCCRNGGCNGDDNTTVLDWAKATGIPTVSDYGPYVASPNSCRYKAGMTLYKIQDWGFADSNGGRGVTSEQDIKAAIMTYGSVGVAIAADDAFENNPANRVFQGSGSTDINHDVILIGWDDSKGSNGKTAWLLRNSWGTGWGNGGYQWILAGANEVGTEAVWCKAPGGPVPPNPPGPNPPTPPSPAPSGVIAATMIWRGAVNQGDIQRWPAFRANSGWGPGTYDVMLVPHKSKESEDTSSQNNNPEVSDGDLIEV